MTELKTLEDIKCRGKWINDKGKLDPRIYVDYDELKAEAVKWVKEDKEWYRTTLGNVLKGKQINSITMDLLRRWMKRLDIKEEDLK